MFVSALLPLLADTNSGWTSFAPASVLKYDGIRVEAGIDSNSRRALLERVHSGVL